MAENLYYFKDTKDLRLEKPVITKKINKTGGNKYEIKLTTDKLAKNVALFTGKSEGKFSHKTFDMFPDVVYTIQFTGDAENLENDIRIMSMADSF